MLKDKDYIYPLNLTQAITILHQGPKTVPSATWKKGKLISKRLNHHQWALHQGL